MSAWEYRQIDEDGGMGWARPVFDGYLFAWGAGVEHGAPHPGGWCYDRADESGDLDEEVRWESDPNWTAEDAKAQAEASGIA